MSVFKALLGSLAVYLTPLAGPHEISFLGERFAVSLRRGEPEWALWEVGAALILQSLAFAVLYLHFTRRSWRTWAAIAGAVPTLLIGANWVFQLALPSKFLIERDSKPETAEWRKVCAADGWWLQPARPASFASVPLLANEKHFALLRMPGCQVVPLAAHTPREAIESVSPSGAMLLREDNKRWFIQPGVAGRVGLGAEPNDSAVVSDDGARAGILLGRRLTLTAPSQTIELALPHLGSYTLVGIDGRRRTLMVTRNSSELLTLGFDGQVRGTPLDLSAVGAVVHNAQFSGKHWLVWDAYRDRGRYRAIWSLPAGVRTHEVLKGRGIASAARTPSGHLIAISTSSALNIGSFPDTVYVLRAADSIELYRRRFSRYSRLDVRFLDDRHFAYTRFDGTKSEVAAFAVP